MIRNIINLKAIILYFRLILCLIAGMPTPAYGSSSYPVKEESYVLVINSYVDGERWSGNLLNMISKFATPEEYTLRIDHISVMLVDTPEKLKEKQEVFFEANKKKPDGIIYLGVNGWAFMRDKIREKWGDIPTLVCSETGEMAENECYFNQRHSSDRVIPLQEAVKGYNATGLVIPYYVKGSIDLVKELIPGLKRLIFISDRRYVSTWLRDEMEKHMQVHLGNPREDYPPAYEMIGRLFQQISLPYNLDMQFGLSIGSGAYLYNVPRTMANLGFSDPGVYRDYYDTEEVKQALLDFYPVLVTGYAYMSSSKAAGQDEYLGINVDKSSINYSSGHTWLVDQLIRMHRKVTIINPDGTDGMSFTQERELVHCNFGWNGTSNGLYYSGAFDTVNGCVEPLNNTDGTAGNYQYYMQTYYGAIE